MHIDPSTLPSILNEARDLQIFVGPADDEDLFQFIVCMDGCNGKRHHCQPVHTSQPKYKGSDKAIEAVIEFFSETLGEAGQNPLGEEALHKIRSDLERGRVSIVHMHEIRA